MWRQMTYQDLTNVFQLADATWGADYHESFKVYEDKFLYYPNGCKVYEINGAILGYIFWYPWTSERPPALNTILDKTTKCDCIFLHDIVIENSLRGRGISTSVINECLNSNKIVTLSAANRTIKTKHLWEHFGFVETDIECDYGVYMIRNN